MIAGMTYYQICWYFVIYSFLGWCIEVAFHAVTLGKVVNRGFLNGPVCPVYGFGMILVLACANLTESNKTIAIRSNAGSLKSLLILFVGGMILATLVELIAGWLLDKCFHMRWWDYSDKPLNFHGYICLEFSIIWGLAITAIVTIMQPLMEKDSQGWAIPPKYGWPVLLVIYLALLADLIVTILTIVGMNKKIAQLDKLRASMRVLSDKMSESIADTTIKTSQNIGQAQVQAALGRKELALKAQETRSSIEERADLARAETKADLERQREEYRSRRDELERKAREIANDLTAHRAAGSGRILRAFPQLEHHQYKETLSALKDRLQGREKKNPEG